MMITYKEFVRGVPRLYFRIASSRLFARKRQDCFYETVQLRDDEESFPLADVMRLPKEIVKVCMVPDAEPVELELHVDSGDYAYAVEVTSGIPE